jgi:hypothetical protein
VKQILAFQKFCIVLADLNFRNTRYSSGFENFSSPYPARIDGSGSTTDTMFDSKDLMIRRIENIDKYDGRQHYFSQQVLRKTSRGRRPFSASGGGHGTS